MTTPPVAAAAVAALAGLLLAPIIGRLAHHNLTWPHPPSRVDAATTAAATGLLAAAATAGDPAGAVVAIPLIVFGLAAAIVDVREQRLPDTLTSRLLLATTAVITAAAILTRDGHALLRSITVACAATVATLGAKAIRSAAVGWGDVKLMPSLGATLGWWRWDAVLTAAILWIFLIGVTAVIVSLRQRRGCAVVPYGPALIVGTFGGLVGAG